MKIKGLTIEEVLELRNKYGMNELTKENKEPYIVKIFHIMTEPMFILLLIAAAIYFLLGEVVDGCIMLVSVGGIMTIEIIQEWKTDNTLRALKNLSEPKISVLRDNEKTEIYSKELVPGDIMYIQEGIKIPADGNVLKCSGLKVLESSLTGESEGVWKTDKKSKTNDYWRDDYVYQGTLVIQGTGIIRVDKIGEHTEYGKIGANIASVKDKKSLLQTQVDKLVKLCAALAFGLFLLVYFITFVNSSEPLLHNRIVDGILSGITLAMAMIPEEFPVVLTVFLSLGAWRLAKNNSLVKKMSSVEALGAISVLCVDKTGTITKNEMEITEQYLKINNEKEFALHMCLSCEEETYDPMEIAMLKYAKKRDVHKKDIFNGEMVKEYPFSNDTKMTGNAWFQNGSFILSAKGSPESIIKLCKLNKSDIKAIEKEILKMQKDGLRVIAVASKNYKNNYVLPDSLVDAKLDFEGLVGLLDPPRENIRNDIAICKKAGVRVVMITGDNGVTATSIANSIGMDNTENIITGEELNSMTDDELQEKVKNVSIFSRVIPEHKMRIVTAFQKNGDIVGMTGDGVNDAPALKKADIGIAMGKKGSDVSREAADLILMDDNFSTIVETIKDGRRIYDNLKKAIGYIFVVHIPIALTSLMAPLLGVLPKNLMLLPIQIVLFELLIDPTCSIVLERQPAEGNILDRKPRNIKENLADKKTLVKSFIQGFVLFMACFGIYCSLLDTDATLARTMGFLIIVFSNIFLVQVNSSNYDYAFTSVKKLAKDKVLILINVIILIAVGVIVYSPFNTFFRMTSLTVYQLLTVILISFIAVFWYEIVKYIKRIH